MATKQIAIATMTLDQCRNRELMERALHSLAEKGYAAYVADGGSSLEFIDAVKKMGHNIEFVPGGLVCQQKNSIFRAAQVSPNILYTEPDKFDWINSGLEQSVDEYFARQLEFAAVSRTPEIMATFPEHQQRTENFANDYISRIVLGKIGGDFIYGPKLFISPLAETLNEESSNSLKGWQTLMYLVAKAHKRNLKIGQLPYAAKCPMGQRTNDSEEYRIKQMIDNFQGFFIGLG